MTKMIAREILKIRGELLKIANEFYDYSDERIISMIRGVVEEMIEPVLEELEESSSFD